MSKALFRGLFLRSFSINYRKNREHSLYEIILVPTYVKTSTLLNFDQVKDS